MLPEVLDSLAELEWLALGVLLGCVFAVLATGTFLVGGRLFPTAAKGQGSYRSGETRRRVEIRQYLRAIDEPFAEDHPVGEYAVAFYLPERDVVITFDPRTYYDLERSAMHVILAEHEMPGFQLGTRLPFETPALGETLSTRTDAAFAVLGVPRTASAEEVRAAYRRRVKEVHPDHGGDKETFRRVREAYAAAREHAG